MPPAQNVLKFADWFEIGKHVKVRIVRALFPAVVLEDRGAFGPEGKHIVRVAIFPDDPEQRAEFEVSEDQIQRDAAELGQPAPPAATMLTTRPRRPVVNCTVPAARA